MGWGSRRGDFLVGLEGVEQNSGYFAAVLRKDLLLSPLFLF